MDKSITNIEIDFYEFTWYKVDKIVIIYILGIYYLMDIEGY